MILLKLLGILAALGMISYLSLWSGTIPSVYAAGAALVTVVLGFLSIRGEREEYYGGYENDDEESELQATTE